MGKGKTSTTSISASALLYHLGLYHVHGHPSWLVFSNAQWHANSKCHCARCHGSMHAASNHRANTYKNLGTVCILIQAFHIALQLQLNSHMWSTLWQIPALVTSGACGNHAATAPAGKLWHTSIRACFAPMLHLFCITLGSAICMENGLNIVASLEKLQNMLKVRHKPCSRFGWGRPHCHHSANEPVQVQSNEQAGAAAAAACICPAFCTCAVHIDCSRSKMKGS